MNAELQARCDYHIKSLSALLEVVRTAKEIVNIMNPGQEKFQSWLARLNAKVTKTGHTYLQVSNEKSVIYYVNKKTGELIKSKAKICPFKKNVVGTVCF